METIIKKINIDSIKNHDFGVLPFIHYETGEYMYSGITSGVSNYGHYVCDLGVRISGETKGNLTYEELISLSAYSIGDKYNIVNSHGKIGDFDYTPENTKYMWNGYKWIFYEKVIKYLDIINRYRIVSDLIKNAIFCKCVNSRKGKILKKCKVSVLELENCEKFTCSEDFYEYIPINNQYVEILDSNKDYFKPEEDIELGKHYMLLSNFNVYLACEEWGKKYGLFKTTKHNSFTFKKFIDDYFFSNSSQIDNFFLVPPIVELPILLEQEVSYDTLYYPCEYTLSGKTTEEVDINYIGNKTLMVGTDLVPFSGISNNDIEEKINFIYFNSYDNNSGNSINALILSGSVVCESKLNYLIHNTAYEIIEGLTSILEGWTESSITRDIVYSEEEQKNVYIDNIVTYNAGKIFKCLYYYDSIEIDDNGNKIYPQLKNKNVYQVVITEENEEGFVGWWECMEPNDKDISHFICRDGIAVIEPESEENEFNIMHEYRNITLLNCITHYVPEPAISGEWEYIYYFKAAYQNGKINPSSGSIASYNEIKLASFPFIVGEPVNVEICDDKSIRYNMVLNANRIMHNSRNSCEIDYVLGAVSGVPNTGIFYKEILYYNSGVTENVFIDKVAETNLWYEYLDYNTNLKECFNETYNTYFDVRIAEITKMELSNMNDIKYPLISKEGVLALYDMPMISTDIIFDRGIASAFEKHFKLSECNTFQDLKNYGNNIFNL